MLQQTNQAFVRGSLARLPDFSHETGGKRFFRLYLEVPRLSGALDTLPVLVREEVLNTLDLSGGEMLSVAGQVRSHNIRSEGRRKLLIFLYADSITAEDGPAVNNVDLQGTLCREPVYRRTPLGREICDCMLAVPRGCHRADYIPCILWGSTARKVSALHTADHLRISGRLQSRVYTKLTPDGAVEMTAYEVSAMSAEEAEFLD